MNTLQFRYSPGWPCCQILSQWFLQKSFKFVSSFFTCSRELWKWQIVFGCSQLWWTHRAVFNRPFRFEYCLEHHSQKCSLSIRRRDIVWTCRCLWGEGMTGAQLQRPAKDQRCREHLETQCSWSLQFKGWRWRRRSGRGWKQTLKGPSCHKPQKWAQRTQKWWHKQIMFMKCHSHSGWHWEGWREDNIDTSKQSTS